MSRLRRMLVLAAGIGAMLLPCATGHAQSILTFGQTEAHVRSSE
jgi:hypothetical protein